MKKKEKKLKVTERFSKSLRWNVIVISLSFLVLGSCHIFSNWRSILLSNCDGWHASWWSLCLERRKGNKRNNNKKIYIDPARWRGNEHLGPCHLVNNGTQFFLARCTLMRLVLVSGWTLYSVLIAFSFKFLSTLVCCLLNDGVYRQNKRSVSFQSKKEKN